MTNLKQSGLSLIEVLVTILILALGMVGIVFYTAAALHASAANHDRANAVQAIGQAVEPIIYSVNSAAALDAALLNFAAASGVAVKNDNDKDSYSIALKTVRNGDGVAAAGIPVTLISPVTVEFGVSYVGANDKAKTVNSSYTFFFQ
ncbi:MAG: prepilin-type N-terminal cleavage/methylation domain-containing protein [Gallionella sp.]